MAYQVHIAAQKSKVWQCLTCAKICGVCQVVQNLDLHPQNNESSSFDYTDVHWIPVYCGVSALLSWSHFVMDYSLSFIWQQSQKAMPPLQARKASRKLARRLCQVPLCSEPSFKACASWSWFWSISLGSIHALCIETTQNISKLQMHLKRSDDPGTPAISVDFGGAKTLRKIKMHSKGFVQFQ